MHGERARSSDYTLAASSVRLIDAPHSQTIHSPVLVIRSSVQGPALVLREECDKAGKEGTQLARMGVVWHRGGNLKPVR